jgi:hypothetical protein
MARSQGGRADGFPLLAGEETGTAQDAPHWINVYEQLIAFCRSVLAEDDVDFDRSALDVRQRHFEQRLEHWLRQLDGSSVGAERDVDESASALA